MLDPEELRWQREVASECEKTWTGGRQILHWSEVGLLVECQTMGAETIRASGMQCRRLQ